MLFNYTAYFLLLYLILLCVSVKIHYIYILFNLLNTNLFNNTSRLHKNNLTTPRARPVIVHTQCNLVILKIKFSIIIYVELQIFTCNGILFIFLRKLLKIL